MIITQRRLLIILAIVALIVGLLAGHFFLPKIVTQIEPYPVVVEHNNTIYIPGNCTVSKVTCPTTKQLNNEEPAKAYVELENGTKQVAGSHYTNEQPECARLHNKSLC